MFRRLLPITLLAVLFLGSPLAQAQAPISNSEIMLSWRSNGFAPGGFMGRAAAAGGGTVLLTTDVLVNGRPANLSGLEIRWYINDELYDSGIGMQSTSVPIAQFHQDSLDVRVEIIAAPFSATLATLSVPLTDPLAVIEPKSGPGLTAGDNEFAATAYSFNVTNPNDLLYSWTVNNQTPQTPSNPRQLIVSFDGQPTDSYVIGLNVQHPQNSNEASAVSVRMVPALAPAQ